MIIIIIEIVNRKRELILEIFAISTDHWWKIKKERKEWQILGPGRRTKKSYGT